MASSSATAPDALPGAATLEEFQALSDDQRQECYGAPNISTPVWDDASRARLSDKALKSKGLKAIQELLKITNENVITKLAQDMKDSFYACGGKVGAKTDQKKAIIAAIYRVLHKWKIPLDIPREGLDISSGRNKAFKSSLVRTMSSFLSTHLSDINSKVSIYKTNLANKGTNMMFI